MTQSYAKFFEKLESGGIFQRGEGERTDRSSTFQVSSGNIIGLFNTSVNYIANNDITFSEEEVNDFLERHPAPTEGERKSLTANSSTSSLKDYLLLSLAQEEATESRNSLLFKYLSVCHPVLLEKFPHLKEAFTAKEEFQKSKEQRPAGSLTNLAHKNLASLLGTSLL